MPAGGACQRQEGAGVFVARVMSDGVLEQAAGFHIAALLKGVDPLFGARLAGAQGKRQQEEGEEYRRSLTVAAPIRAATVRERVHSNVPHHRSLTPRYKGYPAAGLRSTRSEER